LHIVYIASFSIIYNIDKLTYVCNTTPFP